MFKLWFQQLPTAFGVSILQDTGAWLEHTSSTICSTGTKGRNKDYFVFGRLNKQIYP